MYTIGMANSDEKENSRERGRWAYLERENKVGNHVDDRVRSFHKFSNHHTEVCMLRCEDVCDLEHNWPHDIPHWRQLIRILDSLVAA